MKLDRSNIKVSRIYFLIVIITFIIYGNSINNEYSLDDNIVIANNKLVEGGFSAIPKIFLSRYAVNDNHQTYEYRPLVTVSFAVEKQFFKHFPASQTKAQKLTKDKITQANISHFINVLLYALTCILVFQILAKLLSEYNIILPLLTTLIFLVHPLHTEVVDNIKCRDELLMLLFMLLSIKYFIKYADTSQIKYLLIAPLFTLLSLLSKRNGFAIVGILPVMMYFKAFNYKKILFSTLSILLIWLCFDMMQKGLLTSKAVRNFKYFENPLLFSGNFMDKITVGLYCSLFYLKMLIFPKDLSFYYGYNQIPMATWSYWQVWLSLIIYLPLSIFGLIQLYKRKVLGLGIILWLGVMLSVINILFPIVGIVADRFTYTFSLGFCLIVVFLLLKIFKINFSKNVKKLEISKGFLMTLISIVMIYSGRTIARNPNWHDELTLYAHDIVHLQESAKAHALFANTLYPILAHEMLINPSNPQNKGNIQKLIYHYKEAIRIDSTYLTSINNLGSVYMNYLEDYSNAIKYCSKAVKLDSNYLEAHFNLGFSYKAIGDFNNSLYHFSKVIIINPNYMNAYPQFNSVAVKYNKLKKGITILKALAKKVTQPKYIYLNIANLYSLDNYNVKESLKYLVLAFECDETDKQLCNHIASVYYAVGNVNKANYYQNIFNKP